MSRATDLAPLFFPPPSNEVSFRQGQVVSFNLDNGENVIDVGGAQLTDVPLLNVTDSVSLEAGTIVALLKWKSSWWIIGRVILPNSPGYGQLCAFEENGEGVCLSQNGLDIYPPDPPADVARIFAQHFSGGDERMWLEMIPPRDFGTTGDNRFILEGKSDGNADGSFSLITTGSGTIDTGTSFDGFIGGDYTIDSTGSFLIHRVDGTIFSDAQAGDNNILASGSIFLDTGSAGGEIQLLPQGRILRMDVPDQSASANCLLAGAAADPKQVFRATSARKNKLDIEDVHFNPREVINLRPRTWRDKWEVGQNPDTDRWHVGFIAEEVDELGLTPLVDYDEEGNPRSLAYDRFTAALIELIKDQDRRITELEARLQAVDGQQATTTTVTTTVKPKRKDY